MPFLVLFWGPVTPFVADAHAVGVELWVQVGSVDEARTAAEAGVDAVIAQGVEAGGHVRGRTSIWELLPAVVEAVRPVPVLASGAIGDGEGVARALRLGAQAVSLGTRFVASDEAFVHPDYKRRILESGAEDTFYSGLFDVGWPTRRIACSATASSRSGRRPAAHHPVRGRGGDADRHEPAAVGRR